MAIENVNLLKIQLVNQMRTFIKGMSVFFGSEVDTQTDSELDIQSKVKMFLENPQLAEEMTLEDIVVLLEDFNDTLETAPFKDVISSLKTDIQGLRADMIELVNRPVTPINTETTVIKEVFNTEIFDSIQKQVTGIAGKLQGYATKESVVKLQLRVRDVEDAIPVLQAHIDDLAKEIDAWKKKKEVPIHRGGGDQSMTLGVTSIFGRTGAVIAVAGDYNASQITYTPSGGLTSTNVQGALDELAARSSGGGTGDVVGPAGAIDDEIVVFDGTTGKLIRSAGQTMTALTLLLAGFATKLGFITVTQAVDLDQIESDTVANNAKVSNATHTGEVTGSTVLTIDKTAITGKTAVTPVGADYLIISDTSDSGNLKKVLISDLPGGGGGGTGTVDSIVAGDNVVVDSTDPANPIVSAYGANADGGFASSVYLPVQVINGGTA